MSNVATALKSEISRVARKELRAETTALKKAVGHYRSEIAALKRRTQALEQALRGLAKSSAKAKPAPAAEEEAPGRFSAKGFASFRQRMNLSAEACGKIIGTSGQAIYNWESGKVKPRPAYLPAVAALRAMGKREILAKLAALEESA